MLLLPYDPRLGKEPLVTSTTEYGMPRYQTYQDDLTANWLVWCEACGTQDCMCGTEPMEEMRDAFETRTLVTPLYGWGATKRWGVRGEGKLSSLYGYMREFYSVLACDMVTKGEQRELTDKLVNEMADTLARAVVMSCLGEARYHASCVLHASLIRMIDRNPDLPMAEHKDRLTKTNIGKWVRKINAGGFLAFSAEDTPRHAAVSIAGTAGKANVKDVDLRYWAGIAKSVHSMHVTNFGGHTNTGVGGPLWLQGAQLAFRYLSNRIPAVMFVDQTFDLVHNGGTLLNKVLNTDSPQQIILDWRQNATLEEMLAWAPNSIREQYGLAKMDLANPSTWMPKEVVHHAFYGRWNERNLRFFQADINVYPKDAGPQEPNALIRWWMSIDASKDVVVVSHKAWQKLGARTMRQGLNVPPGISSPASRTSRPVSDLPVEPRELKRYAVKVPAVFAYAFSGHADYTSSRSEPNEDLGAPGDSRGSLKARIWEQHNRSHWTIVTMPGAIQELGPELVAHLERQLGATLVPHDLCPLCTGRQNSEHSIRYAYNMSVQQQFKTWRLSHPTTRAAKIKLQDYPNFNEYLGAKTLANEGTRSELRELHQQFLTERNLMATPCTQNDYCVCLLAVPPCCDQGRVLHSTWFLSSELLAHNCARADEVRAQQAEVHERLRKLRDETRGQATWSALPKTAAIEIELVPSPVALVGFGCEYASNYCGGWSPDDSCCCHAAHHNVGHTDSCQYNPANMPDSGVDDGDEEEPNDDPWDDVEDDEDGDGDYDPDDEQDFPDLVEPLPAPAFVDENVGVSFAFEKLCASLAQAQGLLYHTYASAPSSGLLKIASTPEQTIVSSSTPGHKNGFTVTIPSGWVDNGEQAEPEEETDSDE